MGSMVAQSHCVADISCRGRELLIDSTTQNLEWWPIMPQDHLGEYIEPCIDNSNYQDMTVIVIEKLKVTNDEKLAIENDLKHAMMGGKDEKCAKKKHAAIKGTHKRKFIKRRSEKRCTLGLGKKPFKRVIVQ